MSRLRRRMLSESGYSIAELSVAMAAATVVIIGLFSIMVVTLHQTQRTFTKVDATRQARNALALVENQLHSACVDGTPPIQAGSDSNNLIFLDSYGSAATPTPVWHQITFNAAAGTLVDTRYHASANPSYVGGGTDAAWVPGATPYATVTLLSDVAAIRNGATTVPVFQYYAYEPEGPADSSQNTYYVIPDGTNLSPTQTGTPPNTPIGTYTGTTLPVTQAEANNAVEVLINLKVGPTSERLNNPGLTSAFDPVTDSISLRLTTPPDYLPAGAAATGYGPCQ